MIPKTLHYCFGMAPDFGGKPWSLIHHVGVASAVHHIKPDEVRFYYEHEPTGPWWELTKPLVTPIKIEAPREIFGRPVTHPAHRAGVVRLQKLIEHGGIYLDADVLVHRDFDDLLDNSAVLGREGTDGTSSADAIILAEAQAPFLLRWMDAYRSFRGDEGYWSEHAVQVPAQLAKEFPDEITMLPPTAFFYPLWSPEHIEWIFNSDKPIPSESEAYCNHLWESFAWKKYLDHLTPGRVRSKNTNFHRWARPYVEGLPDYLGAASLGTKLKNSARRLKGAVRG